MVAGRQEFDTELMLLTQGELVSKAGAEEFSALAELVRVWVWQLR